MTKDEFQVVWEVADRRTGSILWSFYFSLFFSALVAIGLGGAFLAASMFIDYLPAQWDAGTRSIAPRILVGSILLMFGVAFGFARLTGAEFPLSRESLEKHGFKHAWAVYSSIQIPLLLVFVLSVGFLWAGPFLYEFKDLPSAFRTQVRWLVVWVVAGGVVIAGALRGVDEWHSKWLRNLGMQCPGCGHYFICHTGKITKPGCTNCGGKCRTTSVTGMCDKCGHKVFDA